MIVTAFLTLSNATHLDTSSGASAEDLPHHLDDLFSRSPFKHVVETRVGEWDSQYGSVGVVCRLLSDFGTVDVSAFSFKLEGWHRPEWMARAVFCDGVKGPLDDSVGLPEYTDAKFVRGSGTKVSIAYGSSDHPGPCQELLIAVAKNPEPILSLMGRCLPTASLSVGGRDISVSMLRGKQPDFFGRVNGQPDALSMIALTSHQLKPSVQTSFDDPFCTVTSGKSSLRIPLKHVEGQSPVLSCDGLPDIPVQLHSLSNPKSFFVTGGKSHLQICKHYDSLAVYRLCDVYFDLVEPHNKAHTSFVAIGGPRSITVQYGYTENPAVMVFSRSKTIVGDPWTLTYFSCNRTARTDLSTNDLLQKLLIDLNALPKEVLMSSWFYPSLVMRLSPAAVCK